MRKHWTIITDSEKLQFVCWRSWERCWILIIRSMLPKFCNIQMNKQSCILQSYVKSLILDFQGTVCYLNLCFCLQNMLWKHLKISRLGLSVLYPIRAKVSSTVVHSLCTIRRIWVYDIIQNWFLFLVLFSESVVKLLIFSTAIIFALSESLFSLYSWWNPRFHFFHRRVTKSCF